MLVKMSEAKASLVTEHLSETNSKSNGVEKNLFRLIY